MQMLARNPADAYRRIDLDARVEAASGEALTLICLEEVVATLEQALHALERCPEHTPTNALARAHGIALWLARGVSDDSPLRDAMVQFYGGLASTIARNLAKPSSDEIVQVHRDFSDLLDAARSS